MLLDVYHRITFEKLTYTDQFWELVYLLGLKPRSTLKTGFLTPKLASPRGRLGGRLKAPLGPFSYGKGWTLRAEAHRVSHT